MDQHQHNGQGDVFDKGQRQNMNTAVENIPVSRGVSFLIRKGEKLTTALYMVTDIMPDRDPMKWKVREIGVDVLSDITVSAHSSAAERMSVFRTVIRKVERVVSFLEIAETSQMMSEMNSSILRKEYLGFKDAIEAEWHHIYDDNKRILAKSVVDDREVHVRPEITHPHVEMGTKPSVDAKNVQMPARPFSITDALSGKDGKIIESHTQELEVSETTKEGVTEKEIEIMTPARVPLPVHAAPKHEETRIHVERLNKTTDGESTPRVTPPAPRPFIAERPSPASIQRPSFDRPRPRLIDMRDDGSSGFGRARSEGDRDDRRKIILALIKQKPSLTVKDITKSIPHVSEKTIQRELLAMVAEGILSKKGERRWSTYSLND